MANDPAFEKYLADMLRDIAKNGGGATELELMAKALEGNHMNWRLTATRYAGRPSDTVDRDMAIVRLIGEHRDRIGRGGVNKGIEAAMIEHNLGRDAVALIWRKLKLALEPGNEKIVPFFEKLRRRKKFK